MDVVIIGAGGHGKVVLDILRLGGRDRPIGFLDADPALHGTSVAGLEVLGAANLLPRLRARGARGAIVAIGDNRARSRYLGEILEAGLDAINAFHPRATRAETARLGRNVVLAAGAVVAAEAVVGDSVIVNTSAVVEHECVVADAAHIAPGAVLGGRVRVGARALVGLGSRVLPCQRIGDDAIVAAGAVVIRDVPDGATVRGVPAA